MQSAGYSAASVLNNYVNECHAINTFSDDGQYTQTNYSVMIYTESGHSKGAYPVYLHKGGKYIKFNNVWICIQGKRRFAYNGNWYVIK